MTGPVAADATCKDATDPELPRKSAGNGSDLNNFN
ncbi:hypothetical protein ACSSVQ_002703 [Parvibaculum sp. MBR-TMA-1.3b-4.2]|jgi:hypothetical protein